MAADGTQHLRRQAFVFAQQPEDARHAAAAAADFGEEFRGGARAKRVQMFGAALEAELVEGVRVYHATAFQPCGD
jgi:hypothetical protein